MGGQRPIVIAGAGIGGLTAALALAAENFQVIVCERAEQLLEIGAGIQITPNMGKILARLGLDAAIRQRASQPERIEVRSGLNGSLLASIPSASIVERYGFPWRVLARADLQAVLVNAALAAPLIELKLGTAVGDFSEEPEGLSVDISGNAISAAALIAADGVSSVLRGKVQGAGSARPFGRTAWRATISADDPGARTDRVCLWIGPDAHLVHYPIAGGRHINIVAIVPEDWQGAGWNEPGNPAELARHFAGWSPEIHELIGASSEWRKWAILSVDPAAAWQSGHVALLGDAAHAMPPFMAQGGGMAVEDAAVLAHTFRRSPADSTAALRQYERARKPRLIRVHRSVLDVGRRYHWQGPLAALRDTVLRVAGPQVMLGMNDWIYGWTPEA